MYSNPTSIIVNFYPVTQHVLRTDDDVEDSWSCASDETLESNDVEDSWCCASDESLKVWLINSSPKLTMYIIEEVILQRIYMFVLYSYILWEVFFRQSWGVAYVKEIGSSTRYFVGNMVGTIHCAYKKFQAVLRKSQGQYTRSVSSFRDLFKLW